MRSALFFLFISWGFANPAQWMIDQIQEDLAPHSMHVKELKRGFDHLSQAGYQGLYCKIEEGRFSIEKKALHADPFRDRRIQKYFAALCKTYTLPDTQFIILTDDGINCDLEVPVFAFAKKQQTNAILIPDFEMLWEVLEPKRDWIQLCRKYAEEWPWDLKIEKAFFRGASTGSCNSALSDYGNDRLKMILFSERHPELVDATFSQVFQAPIQEVFEKLKKPMETASTLQHFQYKYLLDVDGNSCTYSRCRWILLSNSVLLKVRSLNMQWYYKALEPWVHFVPVRSDLIDLESTLVFLKREDQIAKAIADRGKELGERIFSKESVDAYVIHLLRCYAKRIKLK